ISQAAAEDEQGRADAALGHLGEALRQLRSMRERRADPNVQNFYARALLGRGRACAHFPERRTEAEEDFSQAVLVWQDLQKRFPSTPLYPEWLALGLAARAENHAALNRPQPAAEDLDRSRQLLEKLVGQFPDLPGYRGHLGRTYAALGRLRAARGDTP